MKLSTLTRSVIRRRVQGRQGNSAEWRCRPRCFRGLAQPG